MSDLTLNRSEPKVRHVIQAVGSSSKAKGEAFVAEWCAGHSPIVYGSYEEVYSDPNVDVVYIGTPHGFHKKNCLDAIAAGKNILCEKAFTLNARDAREVFEAAREKNVYVAEAMWLRHRPLVRDLLRIIHEEKQIGEIVRTFSMFEIEMDVPNLPDGSRYKQRSLGPGSLLDLGIYALNWVLLTLDPGCPENPETPEIKASQTFWEDIELSTTAILNFPSGKHGVIASGTQVTSNPDCLARIIGTNGSIEVHGPCASAPIGFTVYPKFVPTKGTATVMRREGKTYDYPVQGRGYQFQADNIALDVLAGRKESAIMPWKETIRVLDILDEMRRQGGTVYEADTITT